MVERDGRDGDHRRARGGRRVEATAESGLKYCHGDARLSEGDERDCRHLLEERRQRARLALDIFGRVAHAGGEAREVFARDVATCDSRALGYRDQMRRRVETGAKARRAADAFEHRGGRAFAVRASDLYGGE